MHRFTIPDAIAAAWRMREAMMPDLRTASPSAFYLQFGDVLAADDCIAGPATKERVAA